MRFAAALVLWLAATVPLAVAVPAVWTQLHVVDGDGYAAMARRAAGDPALQSAMAAELTTRAMALIAARGAGHYPVDGPRVHAAATAFTAGPSFPPLFAQANRSAHDWLFDDPRPVSMPHSLRQGQLSRLSTWGPWLSIGAAALSASCALLTLAVARRRGKALSSLGVSALLAGAGGWAGIEIGNRYINDALNHTTGDIRRIAEVMVGQAEAALHQWLNVTLLAGAALVGLGVLVAIVGGLRT